MDIKLVAKQVRDGHIYLEDLPKYVQGDVAAIVKSLGPQDVLEKKKAKSK